MPRAFSSGALSIWSYAMNVPPCVSAITFVSAAVSVVLPWSTWPIVPTFTCGLVRSNFAFAIVRVLLVDADSLPFHLRDDLFHLALRRFFVVREFHRVHRAPLRHRAQPRRVPEHLLEGHRRGDHLRFATLCHPSDLAPTRRDIAQHVAHER